MRITLSPAEVRIAKFLGEARYKTARSAGVKDAQIGDQAKLDIDINGVGGELAFCKLCNFYPDLSIGARSGGEDCIDELGLTYDVKTTKYQNGSLLATLKKAKENIDYYVLMIGELPNYELVAVVRSEDLFKPENIKNLGHGDGYMLKQFEARNITDPRFVNLIGQA